jgi:hypothetical protein
MRTSSIFTKFYRNILVLICMITGLNASANEYYWVGGSGNWSDFASHWATSSGGNSFYLQIPQSVDNVHFDANSFPSASSRTVTVNVAGQCGNMDWTGSLYAPVFTNNNGITVSGSLMLINAMTAGGTFVFNSSTAGRTITTAGRTLGQMYFNGTGSWIVQDDVTTNSTMTLAMGTLNTNGKNITVPYFFSNTNNTRSLVTGGSKFTLTGSNNDMWSVTAAGMTANLSATDLVFTGSGVNFYGGGFTYRDVSFLGTTSNTSVSDNNTFRNVTFSNPSTLYLYGSNTFNDVVFSGSVNFYNSNTYHDLTLTAGKTYSFGGTQTLTGTLLANGTCTSFITMTGTTIISSSQAQSVSYVSMQNIKTGGSGSFTAINTIDNGGNTGWSITPLAGRDLYWIGGTGNWNDGSHWSLNSGGAAVGCIPTSLDNVFFDANSFPSASSRTVTVNVAGQCGNMDWTGSLYAPVFTNNNGITVSGSLRLINAMTAGGTFVFNSSTAGRTITTAGRTLGQMYFNGTGSWIIQDDVTTNSTMTLAMGTLNTNGKNITVPYFFSNTNNTRSLVTGGSKFTLTGSNNDMWSVTAAGMTANLSATDLVFTGSGVNFYGGGFTYRDVSFLGTTSNTSVSDNNTFRNVTFSNPNTLYLYGSNTFNDVVFSGSVNLYNGNSYHDLTLTAGKTYSFGGTQTLTGTLLANGTCTSFITMTGTTIISSSQAQSISYVSMQNIKTGGSGSFTAINTIDNGGNTGWSITPLAGRDLYWIGGTGNWNDGSHWSLNSGGAAVGCIPTSLDNAFFDTNSFPSASSRTVTVNVAGQCGNMDWTGSLYAPVFTNNNGITVSGSLRLINAMTAGGTFVFNSSTAGRTITTAGRTLGQMYFNGTGSWIVQDDVTTNSTMTLAMGTLNTNGKNITVPYFFSNTSNTRSLVTGGSKFTLTGSNNDMWSVTAAGMTANLSATDLVFTGSGVNFYGGGFTYRDVSFLGTTSNTSVSDNNTFRNVTFSNPNTLYLYGSNTFNDVVFSGSVNFYNSNTYHDLTLAAGKTYSLTGTQTITGMFNASGTGSAPIILNGVATLKKTSGVVCNDYIRVSNIAATGGATWNIGPNGQSVTGNTGWNFAPNIATISLSINASSLCLSNPMIFTAVPVNGGTATYEWFLNNVSVQNGASVTYTNNTMVAGNQVKCIMTSTFPCGTPIVSNSNTITIGAPVTVTISSNSPVLMGNTLNLASSGGATYSWTGPGGFTSTQQNPSITNVQVSQGGTYTVTVTSGGGCTVVTSVNATVTPPPAGGLHFDVTDDYAKLGAATTAAVSTTSGTWEAWVKRNNWAMNSYNLNALFGNEIDFPGNGSFYISLHGGVGFHFRYGSTLEPGGINIASTSVNSFVANSWHHLAATWKAEGGVTTLSLYIDGVLASTGTTNIIVPAFNNLYLGGMPGRVSADATMDEVRVWNRALCQGELQNNMNCSLGNPTAQNGLVAYYPLNQGYVNTNNSAVNFISDASAANQNATLFNFALTGTTSNWVAGNITGSCTPFVPSASINAGGPTTFCSGGSVILTASTGSSYLWSNGAISQSINVTQSGDYSVTVTNNGCTATSDVVSVIVNPLPTVAAITGTTSLCASATTQLSNNTTGGTWSSSNASVATVDASGLVTAISGGSAIISYTVTNGNSCSRTATVTVNVSSLPSATITASGPTTVCAGSVALNANSGNGLSYQWKKDDVAINGATGSSYTANATGNYTVTITSNGCTVTSAVTAVTVNTLPSATITGNTTGCESVTLTAAGGTTYSWSGGSDVASATNTFTSSGTYTLTATNANNCSATASATVTVLPAVSATVNSTNPTCVSNGAITISNPQGAVNSNLISADFSSLPAGASTSGNTSVSGGVLILTPAQSGTQGYLQFAPTANKPNAVSASFDFRVADGNGADGFSFNYGIVSPYTNYENGIVSTGLSVGFIEFQSSIRITYNGAFLTSVSYSGLMNAGYRNCTVTVNESNQVTVSIAGTPVINNYALPSGYATADKSSWVFAFAARCGGLNNMHSIDNVNISGNSSLQYSIDGTNWQTATTFSVPAGNYTVQARLGNGSICGAKTIGAVTLLIPANPVAPSVFGASRCGAGTLALSATAGGGETIDWYSAASGGSLLASATNIFTTPSLGTTTTYYAQARNLTTGCVSARTAVTAEVTIVNTPVISGSNSLCAGATVQLTTSVAGGTWSSASTGVATVSSTGLVNGLVQGISVISYTVTSGACGATATANITVNPLPNATIGGTVTVCKDAAAPVITFTGSNATAPYTFTYTINGGVEQTVTSSGNTATISVPTTTAGNFVYALVSVKDAGSNTCTNTASGSTTVTVNASPVFTASPSNLVVSTAADCKAVVNYMATVSGVPTPSLSYTFSGATTGSGSGTGSGTIFNKGVTAVTISAANTCATSTFSFTATIKDDIAPVAVSKNITVYLNAGGTATITPADIDNGSTDNCGISSLAISKSTFNCSNLGANNVILTVTDNAGPQPPAPDQQSAASGSTPIGFGNFVQTFTAGTTGNLTGLLLRLAYSNSTPGVIIQVREGAGAGGNLLSTQNVTLPIATGTYPEIVQVTQYDLPSPVSLVSGNIYSIVVWGMGGTFTTQDYSNNPYAGGQLMNLGGNQTNFVVQAGAPWNGFDVYFKTLMQGGGTGTQNGAGSSEPSTEVANVASCTAVVTVVDNIKPTISAPSNVTVNINNGCTAAGVNLGTPVTADNCSVSSVTNNAPASFPIGNTTVIWTVTDGSGNTNTATQLVTVTAPEIDITGNNISIASGTAATSTSNNTDFGGTLPGNAVTKSFTIKNTGTYQLLLSSINVSGTDPSVFSVNGISLPATIAAGGSASFNVIFSSNTPGFKNAIITLNNTDCDEASYSFAVKAEITCTIPVFAGSISDINTNITAGTCATVVTYSVPAVSGIPAPAVSYSFSGATTGSGSGSGTGSFFNKGTTNVIITAVNPCGSVSTSFNIIVNDNEAPTISCPSAITRNTDDGQCGTVVTWTMPVATDNCSGTVTVAQTLGLPSGSLYPVGVNTIALKATDASGNTSTCNFTITVSDNENPGIVSAGNQTQTADAGDCGANVTVVPPSTLDNCGIQSVTNSYNGTSNANGHYPVGTTIVTWTVTDIHGNTNTTTQTIVVADNERPTIVSAANQTQTADAHDCGANVIVVPPATHDNCAVHSVTNSYTGTASASGHYPVGTTLITWTVTDIHGNTNTTTQSVTVTDNEKPVVINIPANRTINALNLNCANLVTWTKPTASDNCGIASIVSSDDFFEVAGYTLLPVGVNTITYTVTDIHGNVTTASFNITVVDNQPPVITGCPASITINAADGRCDKIVNWNPPTASDNCPGVSLSTNHISGETFPLGTTTVVYTATDHAGLQTVCSFTVTVVDAQKPILAGVPADVTAECNAVPVAATVTATDNCATSVPVVYSQVRTNGNCSSNYILTRTWTSTDAAGNVATGVQVITVQDTQAPVLSAAPANVTVECNAVPTAATLTATDNCDVPVVVYNETRTNGNCPSNYTLTRTWTATDACGNTSSKTQVITVQDTQAPILSAAPSNVTVECNAVPAAAILTATDNCDAPVVVYNETRTNGNCPSNYILTRTWTATDACGNTSSKTQIITVQDTLAPVLSAAPSNETVECNAVPTAAILTATDNCDAPVVVYNETRTNGNCPSNYILTRTWTATDACGNTSSKTQIITVQDTQAPVLSAAPLNVTVECNAVPTAAILTATDNCDEPTVTYAEVRTNGNCPSNYILTRTWTATDACGNTSSKTQTITVQDTQAPVLSAAPADVTVECNAVPTAATLTATDNCDAPVVVYNETRTNGNCPSNYFLTRTWTATDACGNTSSKTQAITVQDTQAPVLSVVPADATVECNAVPAAAILTATDNCNAPTVVYNESRTNGNCPSNYILTRTWTATDACGNTSSKTQTITVQDIQAPVLSASPADVTVECNAVPTAATLTATDNCDAPTVTYAEVRTNGNCPGNYILTRTWTATDACGNTSSKTQTIAVQDTQAPVLSASPADVTVECNAVPAAAILTATDNCDAPVVVYNETRTNGNCPSNYILTRTWTATDACGNTSSKTQTITVQDTQVPVLSTAPAGVTVECNAVPTAATLTATDNCDEPTVTYAEVRTNGNCPSNYILTRTWTATDACGNTSSKTQTITVQDTQAPVLSAAPADATVECDAVPAAAILTATDNCDAPTVVYNESRTNGNSPSNYTLTRTWTATDACGNTSSKTQTITVRDTKKPVLSVAPANVTVECNAVPPAAILTATDNCDAAPVVTYNEVRTNGNCPSNYILTRTWTATDASGNNCSRTQVITVQDTQKPVLSTAPADVTVACNAVPAAAILTATDNCTTPTVVYNETRTNGSSAFNYTLTRTWAATDACGNSCTKTQVVTVRDTQAPVPTIAVLATLTGDCSVVATAPTANDNCAGIITATTVNPTSYTAQGVYTITWSYNDGQGNVSTQTQRVVVKDQSGPIANAGTLPTVTGQCSATVTTKPTATDACSGVTAAGTTTDPLSYSIQGTYTIHWTYTDNFGNKTYQDQTVIVKDNIAPVPNVATLPTIEGQCSVNITMVTSTHCTDNCNCCRNVCHCRSSACNCNQWGQWVSNLLSYFFGNIGDDNHGCDHDDDVDDVNNLKMQAPTATDNCKGTIIGTTTDPLSYSTQGTYTIHWSFNDGNGNISVQNQIVKVADVEAPVPNAYSLPTVYGTCSATVTAKPTAKDNCVGTVTGTTTDPLTYSANGTYTIHWTFSDGHGNTATQNQTVVINDNIKPNLSEPNDITISCSASTLPATTGMATATDNCGTPVITYLDAINGNKITRTWKATDAAGNYTTDVQIITISDNTKPVITAPNSVTVNCGSSTLPSATGTATATDNCSAATVTYSDNVNGYVTTRTWKATDAAGNYSTATQTITTVDNVKPTISAPNNVTVACGASTHTSATGTATGADACSSVSISYTDATSGNVITRTWKATDASGNFITAAQTITIVDNTKPVISDVNDITISCSASTLPASCGGTPNASDNCSTPVVTYSDVTVGNKITRTWTATDAAGNFASSTQVITIVDNAKPVLTEPNDITVNCGASTLPAATGNATATDNCSTPVITYTDTQSGNVITRTWKATDASGNYATDVQYITVGAAFSATLTSVPTNSTYTGGVNTNLYLGFGAQSTTLAMCSLPSSGAPYTYAWSGSSSNKLSSTTSASPVFTPATFGYYTFNVTATNKYGCTSFATISICVNDIRVPGTNGAKVYVCHTPTGRNAVPQTLQVAISQVSSHIGSNSCGSNGNDRLGSCDAQPCNTTVALSSITSNTSKTTKEDAEQVATTGDELKVTVMPNPTTTYFTLKLESRYEIPISMRVMDARGRVVDAKTKIGANSTIQIGHNYASGTYYAELIQGTTRKVVQMIKGRG